MLMIKIKKPPKNRIQMCILFWIRSIWKVHKRVNDKKYISIIVRSLYKCYKKIKD